MRCSPSVSCLPSLRAGLVLRRMSPPRSHRLLRGFHHVPVPGIEEILLMPQPFCRPDDPTVRTRAAARRADIVALAGRRSPRSVRSAWIPANSSHVKPSPPRSRIERLQRGRHRSTQRSVRIVGGSGGAPTSPTPASFGIVIFDLAIAPARMRPPPAILSFALTAASTIPSTRANIAVPPAVRCTDAPDTIISNQRGSNPTRVGNRWVPPHREDADLDFGQPTSALACDAIVRAPTEFRPPPTRYVIAINTPAWAGLAFATIVQVFAFSARGV